MEKILLEQVGKINDKLMILAETSDTIRRNTRQWKVGLTRYTSRL